MASIIANTSIASVGRVINIALGIGITALLTRVLGVERYGTYALLLSFGTLFQIMADFGLYLTLTREIAGQELKSKKFITTIFLIRLGLLAILFAISFVVLQYVPSLQPYMAAYLIVLGSLALQSMSQLAMGVYQAHGTMWPATLGDLIGRVTQFCGLFFLGVLLVRSTPVSLEEVLLLFLVSILVAAGIHYMYLPIKPTAASGVSLKLIKKIMSTSWPLGLMLLLNVVYFRIDIVMLSFFRSDYEVGLYGLAYKIIENLLFFPAMFGGLLLPHISSALSRKDIGKAKLFVREALQVSLVAALFIGIMLSFFAKPVVILLSGKEFLQAAPIVSTLSAALFCMIIGNIFGFALVALNKRMELLKLYAGLVVFNIMANALFIPLYGSVAAAWATVCTELIAMSVAGYIVWKQLNYTLSINFISKLGVVMIWLLVSILAMPDNWSSVIQILLAILLTGGLSVWLQLFSKKDISLLLSS